MSVEVKSYVPQAIQAVHAGTEEAILETAVKVTSQTKALLSGNVRTGLLKGSYMWKTSKSQGGRTLGDALRETVKGLSAIVGSAVEYAVYGEFGTRFMNAFPSLRPAVDIVVNSASHMLAVSKAMNDTVRQKLARFQ